MPTNPLASFQRRRAPQDPDPLGVKAHAAQIVAALAQDPEAPVRVFDPDAPQLDPARQHAYTLDLARVVCDLGPQVRHKMERGVWVLEPALAPIRTAARIGGPDTWMCHRCGTQYTSYAAVLACAHNIELRRNIEAGLFPCPTQPQRINTGNPPESGWQDLEAGFFPPLGLARDKRLRALLKALGARSFSDLSRVAVNIADGLLIIQANDGRCAWETD